MNPTSISSVTIQHLKRGTGSISSVAWQHLKRDLPACEASPTSISSVTIRHLKRCMAASQAFATLQMPLYYVLSPRVFHKVTYTTSRTRRLHHPVFCSGSATTPRTRSAAAQRHEFCVDVRHQVKDRKPPVVKER